MITAKWTSIEEHSRIYFILMQDLMKRMFAGVGWRCSKSNSTYAQCVTLQIKIG
jgi:hypothetical protein